MLITALAILLTAEADLSVAWISRAPKIDYVWNSANPTREGWPEEGSAVTWIAHVRWLGSERLRAVGYRWRIDGQVVKSGALDFEPQSIVTAELPWTWTFARREIVFDIDRVDEIEDRNNRLLIHTNALGVGIYVERSFWERIGPKLRAANIGTTTFDDWMQKQIRRFNEMARYAIYDETPDGVIDRWRVDEIHLVDDGALPLVAPSVEAPDTDGHTPVQLGTLTPNVLDHTVDMQWGFPAAAIDFYPLNEPFALTIGNSFIHELGHARTMVDVYAWSITRSKDDVQLTPGPPRDQTGYYYASLEHGLMHFDWGHIDRYSAVVMNLMAGRRASRGNYNSPWDIGWFLNDLPATNRVRFIRADGSAIANRTIRIYRVQQSSGYAMTFDDREDFTLTTDGNGSVLLPRNVFSNIPITRNPLNGTAIVEISDGSTRRWTFLDSLQFNLAYWRGARDTAEHTITADAPKCRDEIGPIDIQPTPEARVTTGEVHFEFPSRNFDLHYAVDGGSPVRVSVSGPKALALPPGRIVWWLVDPNVPAPCPPARSSIYAFDHDYRPPPRRRAV